MSVTGIDAWTCHLYSSHPNPLFAHFFALLDLQSLFAVIQESLVAVLGEIHHQAIIHSNSFWARNEKCLKPRGLRQNFNRQLLSPAEEERGGLCCSAGLPGEKGTERWELPLESCSLRWGESPPAPPCCGRGQLSRSSRCQRYLITVRILFHVYAFNLLNGLIVLPSRGVDTA